MERVEVRCPEAAFLVVKHCNNGIVLLCKELTRIMSSILNKGRVVRRYKAMVHKLCQTTYIRCPFSSFIRFSVSSIIVFPLPKTHNLKHLRQLQQTTTHLISHKMPSFHNRRLGILAVGPTVDCTPSYDFVEAGFCTEFHAGTPPGPSEDASVPASVTIPAPLNEAFFTTEDAASPIDASYTDCLSYPTNKIGRVICGTASSPRAGPSTNIPRSTTVTYTTGLPTPRTTPCNKGEAIMGRWDKKPCTGKYLGLDPTLDMDDFEDIDLHPLPFEDVYEDEEPFKKAVAYGLELRIASLAVDAEEYADADLGLGTLEYYLDEGDEELQYDDMGVAGDEVGSWVGEGEGEEEVFFDADVVRRAVEEEKRGQRYD